jgi:hypothetical protein
LKSAIEISENRMKGSNDGAGAKPEFATVYPKFPQFAGHYSAHPVAVDFGPLDLP